MSKTDLTDGRERGNDWGDIALLRFYELDLHFSKAATKAHSLSTR